MTSQENDPDKNILLDTEKKVAEVLTTIVLSIVSCSCHLVEMAIKIE